MNQTLAQEIIRIKRGGGNLTLCQIQSFVHGLVDGSWSDSQIAALSMAIFLKGMSEAETIALTTEMMSSGETINWANEKLNGPVIDKHSTGGVGDKVSLILAPLVASLGGYVPMISGRGLGHTGGTLDKLEAIPGYQTTPSLKKLRETVKNAGCAIIGQTRDLAPADRRLYAIRDVTATVESIPLITASILSKKLAAGLDALVIDVKVGNGAFAERLDSAEELSSSLVRTALGAGVKTEAVITDMNQVLGNNCGNANEVTEVVEFLRGANQNKRLLDVTLNLGASLLRLSGLYDEKESALRALNKSLVEGKAAEYFAKMITSLGGPSDFFDKYTDYLPKSKIQVDIKAPSTGYFESVNTREIGLALIELGAGRRRTEDAIDHSVGVTNWLAIGEQVSVGDTIATLHASDKVVAKHVINRILQAITIGEQKPVLNGPCIKVIT